MYVRLVADLVVVVDDEETRRAPLSACTTIESWDLFHSNLVCSFAADSQTQ